MVAGGIGVAVMVSGFSFGCGSCGCSKVVSLQVILTMRIVVGTVVVMIVRGIIAF